MDITDLKTFLTIADTGSFSAAANHLHVTQPAVSKRLANLEAAFGTQLIERLPRKARLTVAGELLEKRAEAILREIDNTRAEIQNLSDKVVGQLRIATSHHIGLHYLPAEIKRFLKKNPLVELDLQFLASQDIENVLLAGKAELALLTLPANKQSMISYQKLWHDPLCFVVSKDHPLATEACEHQATGQEFYTLLHCCPVNFHNNTI